jgi:hypothetical protein
MQDTRARAFYDPNGGNSAAVCTFPARFATSSNLP